MSKKETEEAIKKARLGGLKQEDSVEALLAQQQAFDKPARHRYTMTELLTASDYSQSQPDNEREWVNAPAVGKELL